MVITFNERKTYPSKTQLELTCTHMEMQMLAKNMHYTSRLKSCYL